MRILDGKIEQVAVTTTEQTRQAKHNKVQIIIHESTECKGIFLRSIVPTIITSDNWGTWKCGQRNENSKCETVRRGDFLWAGTYKITFDISKHNKI